MNIRTCVLCGLAALIGAEDLTFAQIGYPGGGYPGGGYPPGGYPGGGRFPRSDGPGLPIPGRGRKTKSTSKSKTAAPPVDLQSINGALRRLDEDIVFVTADDTRQIEFRRTGATQFYRANAAAKPEVFQPGDHIRIDASRDEEGYFTAVNIYHEREGSAGERAAAARVAPGIERSPVGASGGKGPGAEDPDRPRLKRADSKSTGAADEAKSRPQQEKAAAAEEPDETPVARSGNVRRGASESEPDPDIPRLKRGIPTAQKRASQTPQEDQIARNIPPSPDTAAREEAESPPEHPSITKARERSMAFTETLPSYLCQQHIARFASTTAKPNWNALDLVSMEVVYENGKEQYRNLKVNGKAVSQKMEQLDGAWSTGEFATVLVDLFSPATRARFHSRGPSSANNRTADLFDFEVDPENSHWTIMTAGQSVRPSYRGRVWIDRETFGVLRIEMQTRNMPQAFPFDKAESAVDYEMVRISDQQFLLPVHAEVLSCQRGTPNCSKNVIDFRNYHKYSGQSSITFDSK